VYATENGSTILLIAIDFGMDTRIE
jgi:hypothetical protein